MDRDLEMAIFEFAPGSLLVKDKEKHKAIGFTGSLLDPERRGKNILIQPPITELDQRRRLRRLVRPVRRGQA